MKQRIFETGHLYKVKMDFMSGSTLFISNEVLLFKSDGYSPYDCSFGYEFLDQPGTMKTWWLHEGLPIDTWERYFVPAA
jgi:hypothetical protein